MMEQWKDIPGYEGLYQVSDHGRVKGLISGRVLKLKEIKGGYLMATLVRNGASRGVVVGRLVLEAFVGPCPEGMQCCHDPDPNKKNNRLPNLRWDTPKANAEDRDRHGNTPRGENHWMKHKPELIVRGPGHYKSRLSESLIHDMQEMRGKGMSQEAIGKATGFSQSYVSKVLRGERWAVRRND